jgi:predicted transposase YbfD/YdcC
LTLGELATKEKSNEITAVPELLDMLDIKGDVVTADAGEPDGHCPEDTEERSRRGNTVAEHYCRKGKPTKLV